MFFVRDMDREYSGHIGTKHPRRNHVVFLQADGDELEEIRHACVNIPIVHSRRVVKWTGDLAQFIYDNVFSE